MTENMKVAPLATQKSLLERRARFVYEAARLAAVAANAPIIPAPFDLRECEFKDQFYEIIKRQCGEKRFLLPGEAHSSWMESYLAMGWTYGKTYDPVAKIHPDLVPYSQLAQLERDKDSVFIMLCEIARQWIRE